MCWLRNVMNMERSRLNWLPTMQSLDDALLLARDDPSAAAEAKTFPGGAHVYPIAPPVSPKGVGSLCQERELLAAANEAGREAAEAVLVPLLNRNIASWN